MLCEKRFDPPGGIRVGCRVILVPVFRAIHHLLPQTFLEFRHVEEMKDPGVYDEFDGRAALQVAIPQRLAKANGTH